MLYFAYGSNLLPKQMQRRCPGARAVGRGKLDDWQLIFNTRGAANIVPKQGELIYGALWRFLPHHVGLMDLWEGVAHGVYRRAWVRVEQSDEKTRTAITYISDFTAPGHGRPHYITQAILPGADHFQLPDEFRTEIASWLPDRPIGASRPYLGRKAPRRPTSSK
ncbi:MAG: gamma-glutamylcyclotransferase [Hyphomicrobiaceae bacterium TMED74]|nr:hypothetical protein [Filomicrobium sp.]RPG40575.1 MAG: gamma-glutamylcyclotransferase [Hyphomicrobiaceae bacterium TMED74]